MILPGAGQVINAQPQRGLMFVFFMVLGAWVTVHLAPPQATFLGRHAGGVFVYAMSVLDAYKWARVRSELARHDASKS